MSPESAASNKLSARHPPAPIFCCSCGYERMNEMHFHMFHSAPNRARETVSLAILSKRNKMKTSLRARGSPDVSGALRSLRILRIGKIGSGYQANTMIIG